MAQHEGAVWLSAVEHLAEAPAGRSGGRYGAVPTPLQVQGGSERGSPIHLLDVAAVHAPPVWLAGTMAGGVYTRGATVD